MSHGRPAPGIPDLRGPALPTTVPAVEQLTGVEERLVTAVRAGDELDVRGEADAEVRADVVRDILLGPADARGLRLRGARVVGMLDLDGLRTTVRMRLRDCTLTDAASMRGASMPLLDLSGSITAGLIADDMTVENSLLVRRGFRARGIVSFVGARVGGKLDLATARLDGVRGPALVADRLQVAGDLLLDDIEITGTSPGGTVQLTGARIGGRLSARRMRATNPAGPGFAAANLHVTDMVDLSKGIEVRGAGKDGALRLVGARLGSISLGGALLHNRTGWALAAHYLDVTGTVYLDGVRATGGLRLSGGKIGGQVLLPDAEVDGGAGPAFAGTRLQVAQGVVLDRSRLHSRGDAATVDLRSARIAGDLELKQTRLANPGSTTLRLNTAVVEGRAILSALVVEAGGLDLRDSAVGTLHDDPRTALPDADGFVQVAGLTYRGVPGHPGVTVTERLAWLRRMPRYAAQPYRQLAAAYQAAGHPEDVRRILVAQQEHLRDSGELTGWAATRHKLFGLLLQYGYQPLRAVVALAAVLGVAIVLFLGLAGGTETKVEPPARPVPCVAVDRVGLAIDAAIPLVKTGADDRCTLVTTRRSGQVLAATGWVLTLAGWASASLVVAGYTGLVRKS